MPVVGEVARVEVRREKRERDRKAEGDRGEGEELVDGERGGTVGVEEVEDETERRFRAVGVLGATNHSEGFVPGFAPRSVAGWMREGGVGGGELDPGALEGGRSEEGEPGGETLERGLALGLFVGDFGDV